MNFRLTGIFFAAVLVLVVGLLVSLLTDQDSAGSGEAGLVMPLVQAGIKDRDVDAVELVRTEPTEQRLVFIKTGDGKWEQKEPYPAKLDGFAVDGVVRDLFRAKPVPYPDLTTNLTLHGLDKPTLRVTLSKGEKSATVNLGLTTIGGDKAVTFVTTSAYPKTPVAVRRSDLASLFKDGARGKDGPAWETARWLADYRQRRLLGGDLRDPATDAASLKMTAGGKEFALSRGDNGVWTFVGPAGWGEADDLGDSNPQQATAPFTGVRPLISALAGLQASTADDYIEKPEDLAKFGLNPGNPAVVRVELAGKGTPPEVVYLGKPIEENGKPVVPTRVYAKIEGDPAVIKVTTDRLDSFRATVERPGELRNKDLLPPSRRDKIDAIDLTAGGQTVKLRRVTVGGETAPKWVVYGGPAGPVEAKQAEVQALLTSLTQPRAAKEVLASPADTAFAGPEVKVSAKVWFDGVTPPKDKLDAGKLPADPALTGTPTELTFGRKEGSDILVRRSGPNGADLRLPEAVLQFVTKPRLAFVEPKLKPFDLTKATKLAVAGRPEPLEVEKDAKSTEWKFVIPDAKKGRTADTQTTTVLVGQLASLVPGAVVSDAPAPDELKKWGLEPAALKATVTVDDPDKERVYEFGTPTEDGRSVYARQAGQPYVFTVPQPVADRLRTESLRDHTLFKLTAASVKRLKLRGWKGATTGPETYLFDKDGATWKPAPPTPAGFTPDPAKLTALVEALAAPRADAFVAVGGKPEHGVDVDTNPAALEITVERTDGPAVTLVLGNPLEDGRLVYAASSVVPGEVFTISPAAIRPLTEKPANFKQ
jgi:hypothetical protein